MSKGTPMTEWIKTTEQLPKQGQLVQVITVAKNKPLNRFLAEFWTPEPGVHDADAPGWFANDDEIEWPTHWMPVPEPPTD